MQHCAVKKSLRKQDVHRSIWIYSFEYCSNVYESPVLVFGSVLSYNKLW